MHYSLSPVLFPASSPRRESRQCAWAKTPEHNKLTSKRAKTFFDIMSEDHNAVSPTHFS